MLRRADAGVQASALEALGLLAAAGDEGVLRLLRDNLEGLVAADARAAAAALLLRVAREQGCERAAVEAGALLESRDEGVKGAAASSLEALGCEGSAGAVPALAAHLRGPDVEARLAAFDALLGIVRGGAKAAAVSAADAVAACVQDPSTNTGMRNLALEGLARVSEQRPDVAAAVRSCLRERGELA